MNASASVLRAAPSTTEIRTVFDASTAFPLAGGAGRVVVAACHPDICRSLRGNSLAALRVDRVKNMLKSMSMDPGRVQLHSIAANEPHRLLHMIEQNEIPQDRHDAVATT